MKFNRRKKVNIYVLNIRELLRGDAKFTKYILVNFN